MAEFAFNFKPNLFGLFPDTNQAVEIGIQRINRFIKPVEEVKKEKSTLEIIDYILLNLEKAHCNFRSGTLDQPEREKAIENVKLFYKNRAELYRNLFVNHDGTPFEDPCFNGIRNRSRKLGLEIDLKDDDEIKFQKLSIIKKRSAQGYGDCPMNWEEVDLLMWANKNYMISSKDIFVTTK